MAKELFFRGSDTRSVDDKSRLSIPARMRQHAVDVGCDKFVITRSSFPCLNIYPVNIWATTEAKLKALPQFDEQSAFYLRTILRWCEDLEFDSAGRILIQKHLKDYAEIGQEAFIIGVIDHIEIWRPSRFKEYAQKAGGFEVAMKSLKAA